MVRVFSVGGIVGTQVGWVSCGVDPRLSLFRDRFCIYGGLQVKRMELGMAWISIICSPRLIESINFGFRISQQLFCFQGQD